MIHHIFSVYDEPAKAFMAPFTFNSKGEAIRAFMDTCDDKNHQFYKHAADFTLFHLGEFDNETGQIDTYPTPQSIGLAIEFTGGVNPSNSGNYADLSEQT